MPPISIHALLAESDSKDPCIHTSCWNFYPRSPCGERPYLNCFVQKHTEKISIHALLAESDRHWQTGQSRTRHFYPRSPCGERRTKTALTSTVLNFYPRSPCGERLNSKGQHTHGKNISIHALLAESDSPKERKEVSSMNFYPRSPCGERRPTKTCGCRMTIFLSTLSLRRATADRLQPEHDSLISIHALLAESDGGRNKHKGQALEFLSTLSLRRATAIVSSVADRSAPISIHALLAESDILGNPCAGCPAISIHALLAESDSAAPLARRGHWPFLSTLSLRRATYVISVMICTL